MFRRIDMTSFGLNSVPFYLYVDIEKRTSLGSGNLSMYTI